MEAIRALMVAKCAARSERTQTINQARALVLTGPDDLRARFTQHTRLAISCFRHCRQGALSMGTTSERAIAGSLTRQPAAVASCDGTIIGLLCQAWSSSAHRQERIAREGRSGPSART
ncbi:MAG TPA: hypothetical protein VF933_29230 [Streptosporangiaceae bacterium]